MPRRLIPENFENASRIPACGAVRVFGHDALGHRPEGSNPCRGLRRRKTGFEAHYLTDDEFASLGQALDGAEANHPVAVAALRFLLYTGARKSEAVRLKWEHVHGDRAVLPDSKAGPARSGSRHRLARCSPGSRAGTTASGVRIAPRESRQA